MATPIEDAQLEVMARLIDAINNITETLGNIQESINDVVEELRTLNERESLKNLNE